jgi:hypothetical protein
MLSDEYAFSVSGHLASARPAKRTAAGVQVPDPPLVAVARVQKAEDVVALVAVESLHARRRVAHAEVSWMGIASSHNDAVGDWLSARRQTRQLTIDQIEVDVRLLVDIACLVTRHEGTGVGCKRHD